MKLLGFDIETYREHFCFVGQLYDTDTKQMIKETRIMDNGTDVETNAIAKIEQCFQECDYIISFNGKRFDLPVLAKIRSDLKRCKNLPLKYIYADAQALISYDANNNPIVKRHCAVHDWNAKHFDVLNNCLLRYSLKQWEMYMGLRVRELPYEPDASLTPEMKTEIDDYCAYDVWAMMQIFWEYGWDKPHPGKPTLLSYQVMMSWWPKDLPFAFDRTTQQIAAGIMYETLNPVPPKTNQPLTLFNIHNFDVPDDVKIIIGYIAKAPSIEFETSYKGIMYGKGGLHYMVPGVHRNVFAFDFASLYPTIIALWKLLKTERANTIYKGKRDYRVNEVKHKKKLDPSLKIVDVGLKIFLNAPSGAFRIKSSYSTMFDPAAGEAMCYIGQLVASELAFACPDFDNVIELNTDSIFVKGDANIAKCRELIKTMKDKHGLDLEEEYIPALFAKDVNNYIVYDEHDNFVDGKGIAYSDFLNKKSNIAVYNTLFKSLIKPTIDFSDWKDRPWNEFIIKYHKSAASKYAIIGNEPMKHKNYYFMWTTRDCPDAQAIAFSRDIIDRKNGAIKARFGVWSQDMADLEKYFKYVDFEQYKRDLDVELGLWGREDLITTHLSKIQRKSIKSLGDLIQRDYI